MKDFTNRTGYSDKEVRKAITYWLKNSQPDFCPFVDYDNSMRKTNADCKKLCHQVFPRHGKDSGPEWFKHYCPCQEYSLKYVIRIAKQAIRELGG